MLRHKETHEAFELIEKSSQVWSVYDTKGERRMFKLNYLEEVTPAPMTWTDVTEECEVAIGSPWGTIRICRHGVEVTGRDGYRMRKIMVPRHLGTIGHSWGWVFLVEKGTP